MAREASPPCDPASRNWNKDRQFPRVANGLGLFKGATRKLSEDRKAEGNAREGTNQGAMRDWVAGAGTELVDLPLWLG